MASAAVNSVSDKLNLSGTHSPLEVQIRRNGMTESRHFVHLVVATPDGKILLERGKPERMTFARSANKMLQALPFLESGAVEAFGLEAKHISLAMASHSSEPEHVAVVQDWLSRLGLSEADLECGAHLPSNIQAAHRMIAAGDKPNKAHNNCSGKHANFLSLAVHKGWPTRGYLRMDHPVQQSWIGTIEMMAQVNLSAQNAAVDGCGIPTIAMPLANLAYALARFADPVDLPAHRKEAIAQLCQAVWQGPWYMAGSERLCSAVNSSYAQQVLAKVGAEGVFTAALIKEGLGLALKVEDGNERAANVALLWALEKLGYDLSALESYARPELKNWAGQSVGDIIVHDL